MFDEDFSEIAKSIKASEIRELLKVVQNPEIISLAGGLPNPEAFPVEVIREIVDDLMEKEGPKVLQYGSTEGVNSFRDVIVERATHKFGFSNISRDNVLILAGSQQGLYLMAKIFIDKGDIVIVEAPTYVGVLTAFQSYFPTFVEIEMDKEGMNTHLLEAKLKELKKEGKKPKMIYTIPTFQNPAGVTMNLERRKHLLELAEEYDTLVLEDGPYEELRYSGTEMPRIKALDKNHRVVYLGTFSKILSPGIRIAFMIAHEDIIQKAVLAKQGIDLCTNTLSQHIAQEYVRRGYLDKQIPKIIKLYKEKRDTMLDSLEDYFPEGVDWTRPDGGMFLWVTLPEHIDTEKLFPKAIEHKVAYVVGSAFYPKRDHKNTMRLNFTYPSNEKIKEGVKRLAAVIREAL